MSLQNQIENKLSEALKNKDKNTYPTLRLIVSSIKDLLIANRTKGSKPLTDKDITGILKKMIKQRNESCEAYKKAGRRELLESETREIEIISSFLPKQLNEQESEKVCKEAIKKVNASSIKDMGKVMGELKKNYGDILDFSKANLILKGILK